MLRQNLILEISQKSLLQVLGKSVTENINSLRQYNQMVVVSQASPQRKPPSRYDNISRSQFLLSSDALVPMVQSADFPDLNDPASL